MVNSNQTRLVFLDALRIYAMIMMIQGHTIDSLTNPSLIDINTPPWLFWHFNRGLTSVLFLLTSGIVQVYANKISPDNLLSKETLKKRVKVAISLLFIGWITQYSSENIYYFIADFEVQSKIVFTSNILQLIALALIISNLVLYFIKNYNLKIIAFAILTLLFFLPTYYLQEIEYHFAYDYILTNFISPQNGSIFPLFPHASIYFFGVLIGLISKSNYVVNNEQFFKRLYFIIGLPIIALAIFTSDIAHLDINSFFIELNKGVYTPTIARVGISLIIVSLFAFGKNIFTKYQSLLSSIGAKSLYVYVVHLAVIYGTPLFRSFNFYFAKSLKPEQTIILALLVEVISFGIIFALIKVQNLSLHSKSTMKFLDMKYLGILYLLLLFLLRI
jgi:uncharacterized membrane protein